MLKRLAFVVALAVFGACSSPAPSDLPPDAHRGDVALLSSTLAGCYSVASLEWSPVHSREGAKWAKLVPTTFELSDTPIHDSAPDFRRVIVSKPALLLGTWTLTNQQEMIVSFSGLVGVRLVLRRHPTDGRFYGRAEPFSDGELPPGVGVGMALVKKIACAQDAA